MMTSTQKSLYELHAEHREWLSRLAFYGDEINYMITRLEEVAVKNTATDVLAQVEHFQNQLIVQRNELDILKHAINEQEMLIVKNINANPVASDRRKMEDHTDERDSVQQYETIFNALRKEFLIFLSRVM